MAKKYISYNNLNTFLINMKEHINNLLSTKANTSHTHSISNITNLQTTLDSKSSTSHNHNTTYCTQSQIDTKDNNMLASAKTYADNLNTSMDSRMDSVESKLSTVASGAEVNQNAFTNVIVGNVTIVADTKTDNLTFASGSGISVSGDATNDKVTITNSGVRSISTGSTNGTISVNTNGTSANVAVKGLGSAAYTNSSSYDSAGTAQTKANEALTSAKTYADGIKNELLNGAGTAYDTLKELGDLIDENQDAIEALEVVASGKANASHTHTISNITNLQSSLDGKANTSHNHNASNINSGTLSSDRLPTIPISKGGTGATTASSALVNLGITATSTELNYLDGVTSNVQTQLNGKALSGHTHNYLPLSGGTLTGQLIADAVIQNGRQFSNVATFQSTDTVNEIVIKTRIPFKSGNAMPLIHVKGYAYGESSAIEFNICFYIYNDKFCNMSVVSTCPWKPNVYLTSYTVSGTKYVAINFEKSIYYPRFIVDYTDIWSNSTRDYSSNWTVEAKSASASETIISTTDKATVPYKAIANDILGNASTASSATKASQDANGNVITSTYETKTDASSKLTEAKDYTDTEVAKKANTSHTHTIANVTNLQSTLDGKASSSHNHDSSYATKSHSHSNATTSANGFMSSTDKTKLDGIATGANKYSLPTASSSLGGVKTTSTVTDASGYTAVPIISGIPYYKDTNTWRGIQDNLTSSSTTDSLSANQGKELKALVDGKANSSHNHSASNINSGTLSSDRLPTVPISKGGTGATTASGALTNLGLTATSTEINVLDGITATTTELNYVDGVTSNIQTQLNGKANSSHSHASITNSNGNTLSTNNANTDTGFGILGKAKTGTGNYYLYFDDNGTTTNIPVMTLYGRNGSVNASILTSKNYSTWASPKSHNHDASNINAGTLSSDRLSTIPVSKGGTGATTSAGALTNLGLTATATELNYMDGVTSNVQTQLNGKSATSHTHNYAGSSSAGGSATSANKLNTNAGSVTQPVYFSNGVPVATTYALNKTVPSDAKFTDTNTWRGIQDNLTSTSTTDSLSANQGKVLKDLVDTKANSSHTHSYAGSSSVGGSANSAVKLDTNAGDSNTPVYFSGGKPVACTSLDLNTSGSSASCTGNSATSTKLATARSINVGTGVTGTATNFDGSGNITIPVTGIKEAYLSWGGRNLSGSITPIDVATSNLHSANRFAFAKPAGITVEYSTNGSTYSAYSTTDSAKINLVSGNGNTYYIGARSASTTVNDKLRITLNANNMGVYTRLRKLLINISTGYSSGSNVIIEKAMKGSETTFTTVGTYSISGWSGWNSIPIECAFGGGSTQTGNVAVLRLTFGITGVNSSQTSNALQIMDIIGIGDTYWNHPSTMAKTGHLYSYDSSQNATFPAKITATSFSGSLSGNATTATTATKLGTNAGSATQPVYFSDGIPVATTYKLEKSVPSNAVFTDTNTKVTNTLATTTKAYVTGTTSATTNTGTQVFDTGVYLDTTAGKLTATTFNGTTYSGSGVATVEEVKSYLNI